jgi:hypothetical protein
MSKDPFELLRSPSLLVLSLRSAVDDMRSVIYGKDDIEILS